MAADRRRPTPSPRLSHVDERGRARMVDVGDKPATVREAVAEGHLTVSAAARRLVRAGEARKGDPVEVARLAGVMAAKRTADLIPLCHPLPLTFAGIDVTPTRSGYRVRATVRTQAPTGVEMEALTAACVAILTLYDMLKAADRGMVIEAVRLIRKRGGRHHLEISSAPGKKRA